MTVLAGEIYFNPLQGVFMTTPNPKANFYFEKEKKFKKEIDALRMIVLECGLQEDVKIGRAHV